MELWDLYNEKRELTGKTHVRGNDIPEGLYHLVVHTLEYFFEEICGK